MYFYFANTSDRLTKNTYHYTTQVAIYTNVMSVVQTLEPRKWPRFGVKLSLDTARVCSFKSSASDVAAMDPLEKVDFSKLPNEIREKLAELDLELSEGTNLSCPDHFAYMNC